MSQDTLTREQAKQMVVNVVETFYAVMLENGLTHEEASKILDGVNQTFVDAIFAKVTRSD